MTSYITRKISLFHPLRSPSLFDLPVLARPDFRARMTMDEFKNGV